MTINRWGTDVTKGAYVVAHHPRGGVISGKVERIYRMAGYGPQCTLDTGHSCGVDDVIRVKAQVPVRFRIDKAREGAQVTAVFLSRETHPTNHESYRMCYAHVGQHSECSLEWMRRRTRAARPDEYAPLLAELRQLYEKDETAVLIIK
jgi:hypothetical protein